jgi:two-component system sensor histidine kinase AgrC
MQVTTYLTLMVIFFQYLFIATGNDILSTRRLGRVYYIMAVLSDCLVCFLYLKINVAAMIFFWMLLTLISIVLRKSTVKGVLTVSISFISYIFSDYLTVIFESKIQADPLKRFLMGTAIYFCIILIIEVSKKGWEKVINYFPYSETIMSLISAFTFIVYSIVILEERFSGENRALERLNTIILLSYGLISIITCIFAISSLKKSYEAERNRENLKYLISYSEKMEKNYIKLRRFRHDYKNILLSLEGFIGNDDMKGLKNYFFNNIKQSKSYIEQNEFRTSSLANLKNYEVKGLLVNKLVEAQNKNIITTVEMAKEIRHFSVDTLKIVRILGVLLDNAIEAAENSNNAFIRIGFINDKSVLHIIVLNSCTQEVNRMKKIKKSGFSTKGGNRGYGLSSIEEMVSNERSLTLETSKRGLVFSQILTIAR